MGIQDRDWYQEALSQKKKQLKKDDPVKKAIYNPKEFRGKREAWKSQGWQEKTEQKGKVTFWEFFGKSIALLGAILLIIKAIMASKNAHF
jgi:hypothetical protein